VLKPQDLYILLKLFVLGANSWTYASLAAALHMSSSEVHAGLKRAAKAGLFNATERRPMRAALLEFLEHGVRYAFAPERTGVVFGLPTSYAAPVMSRKIVPPSNDIAPVWAHEAGHVRGEGIEPLHASAPLAAQEDSSLYALLALVDAVRIGRARERRVAQALLAERFSA
jgi:hypothetical protein